jgi:hypothetical protein
MTSLRTLSNALRAWRTGRDTQSKFYARMLHNELIVRLCS